MASNPAGGSEESRAVARSAGLLGGGTSTPFDRHMGALEAYDTAKANNERVNVRIARRVLLIYRIA